MKTCIVSAYYRIPSKKPHEFYVSHLKRWFQAIRAPVIFFTTSESESEIRSWGYDLSNVTIVNLPYINFNAWSKFDSNFWKRQKERDVESYHTPELAAIWFEKKEFVQRAFELSDADVFIWCDAGCIRDDYSAAASREFGMRNLPSLDNDTLHVQSIRRQPVKEYYVYPEYRFACAIMAGNRSAWVNHSRLYDSVALEYDRKEISCNSDQYITQSCSDKHPEYYTEINPNGGRVDVWFFFLGIL